MLDPLLITAIKRHAVSYDKSQRKSDIEAWSIAKEVNESYSEHKNIYGTWDENKVFHPDKMMYYVACSYEANSVLDFPRFSVSGETLRSWCDLQETYSAFPHPELLLEATSKEHMRVAKKLAKDGKVSSPLQALDYARELKLTVEEMREHYDPKTVVQAYDKVTAWLDGLLDKDNWKWLTVDKAKEATSLTTKYVADIKRLMGS